jgi:hypothetical protein
MTKLSTIRKGILKQRKSVLEKHTRTPITYDDLESPFPKTKLMKYIELKHGDRLENLIATGTIYELERKLGVDASTISKWRKLIREVKEKKFWEQFLPEEKGGEG